MMTQDEARRLLDDARAEVAAAYDALEVAKAREAQTNRRIAEGLGPYKVGDRVRRAGDARVHEITGVDLFVYDSYIAVSFIAHPLKKDGLPSTREGRWITPELPSSEKWQRVSLPQTDTEGGV